MKKATTKYTTTKQTPDLAELLAAVLSHPELPDELRDGITEGLDATTHALKANYEHRPAYLRLILSMYAEAQAAETAPSGGKAGGE